jgi:hypothetical protein
MQTQIVVVEITGKQAQGLASWLGYFAMLY